MWYTMVTKDIQPAHNGIKRAPAVSPLPVAVVKPLRPVETDTDIKTLLSEEPAPFIINQSGIGLNAVNYPAATGVHTSFTIATARL